MGKMVSIEPMHRGLHSELILHGYAAFVMFEHSSAVESIRQIKRFDSAMALED